MKPNRRPLCTCGGVLSALYIGTSNLAVDEAGGIRGGSDAIDIPAGDVGFCRTVGGGLGYISHTQSYYASARRRLIQQIHHH